MKAIIGTIDFTLHQQVFIYDDENKIVESIPFTLEELQSGGLRTVLQKYKVTDLYLKGNGYSLPPSFIEKITDFSQQNQITVHTGGKNE